MFTNNVSQATYLRKTPPSSDAFRHSGGASLRWTSATVTLYLDVEDSKDNLPGTEQKTSLPLGMAFIPIPFSLLRPPERINNGKR